MVEPHFMGSEIAKKWTYVNQSYINKNDVEVGFGASYNVTIKPSVINAVYRLNNHYRREFKRNHQREHEMRDEFSHVLDCAIAVFYSNESEEFESALAGLRNPDDIKKIFNSVNIIVQN